MPPHPSLVNQQQQRPKKSWLDTVAGAFTREPLTLNEMDLLKAYKAKQYEPSPSKGVFSELGDKVNERGEKLDQLDKKFSDMNAASGDFLKAVKDYNERQERKKWWEF
ncbi:hypothetical protein EDC94DRAFT_115820 [Helicostylum pulchrum]|nr:hypothetical protein EDC94DRAFT_115820 [Helicostylum pulchrum]